MSKEKIDLKAIAEKLKDRVLFPEAIDNAKKYLSKMSKQTENYLASIETPEKYYERQLANFNKIPKKKREDLRGMTVGELRKILANQEISDDSIVLVERIHDIYFEKHGWSVYLKRGEHWHNANKFNDEMNAELERIATGKERKYSMENPKKSIVPKEEMDLLAEQFHPVEGAYKDTKEGILFIYSHY